MRNALAAAVSLIVSLILVAAACGRTPDRPVARLTAAPAEVELNYPGAAEVDLAWEPLAPLGEVEGDLLVFVHLLDDGGEIARTFDHRYPFGWEVGRRVEHRLELYQSVLGPPLPPGDYLLTAGLYDRSGRRWALRTTGEEVGRREYRAATVRVREQGASTAPRLAFAEGWLPLEAGGDRQILGRRWTTGDAAIEVRGAAAPGELALTLTILEPPAGIELRLDEGAGQPAVRVATDCDGSSHQLAGIGSHEVSLAVPAGTGCRVEIRPAYELGWPEGPPRGVTLENLYWRSAAAGDDDHDA